IHGLLDDDRADAQRRNIADTFDRIVEHARRGRGNELEGGSESPVDWDRARRMTRRNPEEDQGCAAESERDGLVDVVRFHLVLFLSFSCGVRSKCECCSFTVDRPSLQQVKWENLFSFYFSEGLQS